MVSLNYHNSPQSHLPVLLVAMAAEGWLSVSYIHKKLICPVPGTGDRRDQIQCMHT